MLLVNLLKLIEFLTRPIIPVVGLNLADLAILAVILIVAAISGRRRQIYDGDSYLLRRLVAWAIAAISATVICLGCLAFINNRSDQLISQHLSSYTTVQMALHGIHLLSILVVGSCWGMVLATALKIVAPISQRPGHLNY